MEPRWYECEIREVDETAMPDLSRVPIERRAAVEARLNERLASQKPERWKLWGPQIETYNRLPGIAVTVIGPVGA